MTPSPRLLLAVAVGGGIGALLRWAAGEAVPDGPGFWWTTLGVNLVGSTALAALPAWPAVRHGGLLAAALGPGLLGGFTTLSATSEQARSAVADGRPGLAAAYLAGSLGACVVGVTLASLATRRMATRRMSGVQDR